MVLQDHGMQPRRCKTKVLRLKIEMKRLGLG